MIRRRLPALRIALILNAMAVIIFTTGTPETESFPYYRPETNNGTVTRAFQQLKKRESAKFAAREARENLFTACRIGWYQVAAHDFCSDGRSRQRVPVIKSHPREKTDA